MSKHLAANPHFIEAFVSECFAKGFNEKQASQLLEAYAQAEFYKTDKNFREGLESHLKKANVPKATWNLIKALATSAKGSPGISTPILTGAAAGALVPEGILPENFQGGALGGAALGGILGALGTRGRGLGGVANRVGKAISKGGLGRTLAGEAGRLVTNKSILKGTGRGVLGGLAAAGTTQALNAGYRRPSINPDAGTPWYMKGQGGSVDAGASSADNPFELPPEIMARVQGEGAGTAAAGGAMGPLADLQAKKNQLVQLENQIISMQSSLPSGANPTSYAERQAMQAQIDNLKMQRNSIAGSISALEGRISQDKANMMDASVETQRLAGRGLASTREEFDMLRKRKQMAEQGGWLFGNLMKGYNNMTGLDQRLSELDPIYSGYSNELEQARKVQDLAQP